MEFYLCPIYQIWHTAWKIHVKHAKENPTQQTGYCMAAAIAQGQYVQWLALEKARKRDVG